MPDYLNRMIAAYLEMPSSVGLRSIDIDEEGRYWITSDGRLLSVVREQPLYKHFFDNGDGYYYTEIAGKKYYLHRLLALSFNQDPNKEKIKDNCEIHHLDRNRDNNDLSNLVSLKTFQKFIILTGTDRIILCLICVQYREQSTKQFTVYGISWIVGRLYRGRQQRNNYQDCSQLASN